MVRDALRRIQRLEARFAHQDRIWDYLSEQVDANEKNIGSVNQIWEIDGFGGMQRLVPISDISSGVWDTSTFGDLYEMLDDPDGAPDDDTTYIFSEWGTTDATFDPSDETDTFEVKLGRDDGEPITTPNNDTDHTILFRARRETGPGVDLVAKLFQGTTEIAADSSRTLGTSYTDYTFTLSEAQAATITDYTDLRLRFITTHNNTYAMPTDDIATGKWQSTPLWEKIDENPSSVDDATTEIDNDNSQGASNLNATFECGLETINDPGFDDRHVLFFRWYTTGTGSAMGSLLEGVIPFFTESMGNVTSYGWTIVIRSAIAISDYSDLSIRYTRLGSLGTSDPFFVTNGGLAILARPRVTACEMLLPS